MKKISRLLLSISAIAFLLVGILPFMPMKTVHADPDNLNIQFDADVSGNVFTFDLGEKEVTATVSGSNYTINGNVIELTSDHLNDLKVTLGNTFNIQTMKVQFHNGTEIVVNGDNELVFDYDDFPENSPHLQIVQRQDDSGENPGPTGGDDTSNYQGNGVSTLNYSINGAIEYTSGGGYDHGITFRME